MSLRLRLTLLFGVVAFVASSLVAAFAFRSTTGELVQSTDRFLERRATETVQAIVDASGGLLAGEFGADQPPRPQRPGRFDAGRIVADDDAIYQVTGLGGRTVSSSAALPSTDAVEAARNRSAGDGRQSRATFDDIAVDGESYRMATVGFGDGGVVQVARSTVEDDALAAALLRRFALISVVVALVAAAVGSLIAQRTTAPLRRLTGVAADVATTRDFRIEVGDVDRPDEIGRLAISFRSMLDALEASRVQQHRLIHDAGHEMRTPLTSMRANVALLERATELPAVERAEVLAAIGSELVELGSLFDEMIDLATDQHGVELVRTPVDLGTVAREVSATWARRSGREVAVSPPAASSVVTADSSMIERALANLVSNAVKFSPDDAPIEIVVGDGSLAVRDGGPGIAPVERDRIFGRFYRSEATRSMPGSGLGLSIVAQVIERHGGETWVADAPAGGAEVGFRLPAM
jgi:two-component system sensor histidine kinase MprB